MKTRAAIPMLLCALLLVSTATRSGAYPGGTPAYVTDAGTFCASCHASMDRAYHRVDPQEKADQEFVENKHYGAILKGVGDYGKLSPEERQALVAEVRKLDAATSITFEAPTKVKPGARITARVRVVGGAGPVLGVQLLDTNLRYQARSPEGDGWRIVGAPRVTGPDDKPQTGWTDRRAPGLGKNINYVNILDVAGDVATGTYAHASVEWDLVAPAAPGRYTLAAALLYGSEKATKLGALKSVQGTRPRGGFGGASGHIRFSPVVTIEVGP
ncbi:MAG: hypothetical protein KC466_13990 [Myxococcales bacterium]|nr:hypothetical protein [Myxococcales bacterium]